MKYFLGREQDIYDSLEYVMNVAYVDKYGTVDKKQFIEDVDKALHVLITNRIKEEKENDPKQGL